MPGKYNRKDHFYNKAKEAGYRSRAAYKLVELQKKYKLLKSGAKVLDLGCWPGGWLQVASQTVGPNGVVVGIDLVEADSLKDRNVRIIRGDAGDSSAIASCIEAAGSVFDIIISDMSPKLSGIAEVDQSGIVACGELALNAALECLRPGGALVMKVFKGEETNAFVKKVERHFQKVTRCELDATRQTSNEFYVLATGLKGNSHS